MGLFIASTILWFRSDPVCLPAARPGSQAEPEALSPREKEVVEALAKGSAYKQIAYELNISVLNRMDLDQVHAAAAEVARYVCSCVGATPVLPEYFRSKFVNPSAGGPAGVECRSRPGLSPNGRKQSVVAEAPEARRQHPSPNV